MEPEVRFCTSADGARIGYATMGESPSLLVTPGSWESLRFVLEEDVGGAFFRALANHGGVARFDRRGTGLSDRDRSNFTMLADVQDIAAVVDSLSADRIALMGSFHLGPAAIAYAARHRERISHLILYGTYARGRDLASEDVKKSLVSMVRSHWGIASRTLADLTAPDVAGEMLERMARDERESATGEVAARLIEAGYETDATEYLAGVEAPTIVIHRRGDRVIPFRMGRELAAALPNARLVTLEGTIHWPWFGDANPVLAAIAELLGEGRPAHPSLRGDTSLQGRRRVKRDDASALRTILFTDIVGHTEMMQRLGDEKGRDVLREHERITRELLKQHGGTEVKTMGDGFMASFGSVTRAVECAIALQRAFDERNRGVGAGGSRTAPTQEVVPVHIRIGLNAGEPIEEEGPDGRSDLFGATVILAARIAAQAEGSEILASMAVRELCAGKGFLFADRGEHAMRGFEDPARVFEVRWRE